MTELQKLINIANKEYDGHFTLMKFTTDWGCCFGTLDDTRMTSYKMSHGKTMSEAIKKMYCKQDRHSCHEPYGSHRAEYDASGAAES